MNFTAALLRNPRAVKTEPQESALAARYARVRAETERIALPLSAEDQAVQSMPDASPTKWHRAHTTWFFETFVLARVRGYVPFDPAYAYLFNSYYEAVGPRHARNERGLITRPTSEEVREYRHHVDGAMATLFGRGELADDFAALVELGLQHEQQHQELMLTDILHVFAQNPLAPAYAPHVRAEAGSAHAPQFVRYEGGIVDIGHEGSGFSFDNELPRHEVLLQPFAISDTLVTNAEWLEFIEADGYENPLHWLADGWQRAQTEVWHAPLYWRRHKDGWHTMTLSGLRPVDPDAPVAHVSYYEADAFARWRGKRLPTEQEWEHASSRSLRNEANFRDDGWLRPLPARGSAAPQFFGDVWQWTQSPYTPYPGYRPAEGAVGEYNGKFMVNQLVLRGGSCVTSADHIRGSYRNFFYPHQRWQFTGLRLAEDGAARRPRAVRDLPPFLDDVWSGLSAAKKSLPSKYFYDAEGSHLFEAICELPEYYLTRSESALLRGVARALSEVLPGNTSLVEFGCGACTKTRVLLDHLPQVSTYVPIDICEDSLARSTAPLAQDYPQLKIVPMAGDFATPMALPHEAEGGTTLGFFSGSTIGNFENGDARDFLRNARRTLGPGGKFLVAFDMVKDVSVLLRAYDDAQGVTARFNLNVLKRINRELGGDFDLSAFSHCAVWNDSESRIEMHLVAKEAQQVRIAGRSFDFARGESIHTENSHKYTPEAFAALAESAGWTVERSWKSPAPEFALVLLR